MRIDVLDHGYVSLVESWGSDEAIVAAARMSTQRSFEGWGPKAKCAWCMADEGDERPCKVGGPHVFTTGFAGDEKLLAYLWRNQHSTPFEMAGLIVEVQAPIFVFREWHRHRVQSFSEASARYAPLPELNYVPTVERLLRNGGSNRQAGSTGAELDADSARRIQHEIKRSYAAAEEAYQDALSAGTPKELARIVLPVGRYSRMRASANLRNWLAFLTLRTAPNAQWEIVQFARAVETMLTEKFPRTLALFREGQG